MNLLIFGFSFTYSLVLLLLLRCSRSSRIPASTGSMCSSAAMVLRRTKGVSRQDTMTESHLILSTIAISSTMPKAISCGAQGLPTDSSRGPVGCRAWAADQTGCAAIHWRGNSNSCT